MLVLFILTVYVSLSLVLLNLSVSQLNMAKGSETVLEGFHEGPIKFPPTYKFDVGTDTYDTR